MKFLRVSILMMSLIMMTSCYTQRITLNPDKKSGSMSIDYSFNDDDFEILSLILSAAPVGGETGTFDPSILIDQNEFKSYINSLGESDFKLVKADISRKTVANNNVYTGNIVINFKDFEILLSRFPASDNGFNLKKDNGTITLQQNIIMDKMGDMETLDNYIDLIKTEKSEWYNKFVNSDFLIEIILKTPIIESKGVTLSKDKKTARYSFKVDDMIGTNRKDQDFMLKF